jgi:hypothetical protein
VAMAIDRKQSPLAIYGDVTLAEKNEDTVDVYKRANLPDTTKFDLKIVFRSTGEITRFVQTIADQLIHIATGQEWETGPTSLPENAKSGPIPRYYQYLNSTAQYKSCFGRARKLVKEGIKKSVAVICMDSERFDTYLSAASGEYKSDHVAVASQEDVVDALKYDSRRFAVTMPEYVGGLQFDHVFVLDLNDEATAEDVSPYHRKQFLTDLYIACSRARNDLTLHASKEDGGISNVIRPAVWQKLIHEGSV